MPVPNESPVVVEPKREEDDNIQKFATSSGSALLAFITPHFPEKVSPRRAAFATVGVQEEFGIESFIDLCASQNKITAFSRQQSRRLSGEFIQGGTRIA